MSLEYTGSKFKGIMGSAQSFINIMEDLEQCSNTFSHMNKLLENH